MLHNAIYVTEKTIEVGLLHEVTQMILIYFVTI